MMQLFTSFFIHDHEAQNVYIVYILQHEELWPGEPW